MSDECLIPKYEIHDVGDAQALSQIYPQNIRDLNIPKVWKKTKGKGITVMVLDTGCPVKHPDLLRNIDISKCRSFIPDEDIFDTFVGHGTHCSGTIGAEDNAEGIVGVAPEVTIITGKVLDRNGRSRADSIRKGLEYCLKINPDIINMSLGGPNPMPEVHEIIKELTKRNIPIVCSAGNNGKDSILYPAQYDECIAVGSYSDSLLRDRSLFSSWGESLDIMAPGEKILSTYLNGSYAVLSGTSMAAPSVSGAIALLIAYYRKMNRDLKIDEIKNMLFNSAIDIGKKGKDPHNGWGIINPESMFTITHGDNIIKDESFFQKVKNFFGNLFKK